MEQGIQPYSNGPKSRDKGGRARGGCRSIRKPKRPPTSRLFANDMIPGLCHGLSRSIWGCSLPLGRSFHQGPVCSAYSSPCIAPDFRSFPLPNITLPHASNRYTQSTRFAVITKLSICDDVFGALSTDGELFVFTPPESKHTSGEKIVVKPQLVWALRKAFTAVKVSGEEGGTVLNHN